MIKIASYDISCIIRREGEMELIGESYESKKEMLTRYLDILSRIEPCNKIEDLKITISYVKEYPEVDITDKINKFIES